MTQKKIELKVIMNEEEWEAYKSHLPTGKMAHLPSIPPSFPVLVATTLTESPYSAYHYQAEHSFVEAADLKKLLGIA